MPARRGARRPSAPWSRRRPSRRCRPRRTTPLARCASGRARGTPPPGTRPSPRGRARARARASPTARARRARRARGTPPWRARTPGSTRTSPGPWPPAAWSARGRGTRTSGRRSGTSAAPSCAAPPTRRSRRPRSPRPPRRSSQARGHRGATTDGRVPMDIHPSCMPRDRRPPVSHDDMHAGARGRRAGDSCTSEGNDYGEMAEWMADFPQPSHGVYEGGRAGFVPREERRATRGAVAQLAPAGASPSGPGGCASRTGRRVTWPASARRRASARVRPCADTAYRRTSARRPAGPRGTGAGTSGTSRLARRPSQSRMEQYSPMNCEA